MPIASLALMLMSLPSAQPPKQVTVPPNMQVEVTATAAATMEGAPQVDEPVTPPLAVSAETAATSAAVAVTAASPTGTDESATAADDGDLVVTARPSIPGDPIQAVNVASFNVTQAIDNAVTGPVAHAFERTVPSPVRSGLRNLLSNLHEPVVFIK
jgi:phospholipid-binding lipoprotein MlaA